MAETITISVTASVKSGPELRASWSAVLPAYEKMEIQVDGGKTASLPLSATDQILLLVVGVGSADGPVSYDFKAKEQQASNQPAAGQHAAGQHGSGQQG